MRPSVAHRSGLVAAMLIVGLVAGLFGTLESARGVDSVIYVVPGGTGTGDGTSWTNARDLQAALSGAVAPAELWVKAGTYTPTSDRDPWSTFSLKNGVAVYGGFAGTETARSQRDVAANVTILSGAIGEAVMTDNSVHVVTGSGTDATAILDGVTITAGHAYGGVSFTAVGGGIFNDAGSPTLANLTISGNTASARGGGLYNFNSSNPVVRNSIVWGNAGGAIVNDTISSVPDVAYSLIAGGYSGSGNLQADPRFVSAVPPAPSTGGDLRLQGGSPAINAGSNAALPAGLTTDRDGNPRVFDMTVDMGAYEHQQVSPPTSTPTTMPTSTPTAVPSTPTPTATGPAYMVFLPLVQR